MRLPVSTPRRLKVLEELLESLARGSLRRAGGEGDLLLVALAHPVRLRILALGSRGPLEARELARECELSLRTIRHHIDVMSRGGVLELLSISQERGPAVHGYLASRRAMPLAMALQGMISEESPGELRRLLRALARRACSWRKGAR